MKSNNMNATVEMITENAQNMGTREALAEYLGQIAANLPDGKLPNGYTADQAADEILNTAVTYTEARDAEISKDDLAEMIAKHCQYMTSAQAAEYLAGIHVFYNHLDRPVDDQTQLAEEIRRMAENTNGASLEEHIDEMLEGLDPQKLPSIFGFVHQVEVNMDENGVTAVDAALVSDRLNKHLDAQQNAIQAAVAYGEVAQGNVEGMAPETNPGMITAGTCAAADAALVAMDEQSGKITAEEAGEQLNRIERAFMVALAGLWGAAYMALGVIGALGIFEFLLGIGVNYTVAWLVAFCVVVLFAGELEEQVSAAHKKVTSVYCRLKKRIRSSRNKISGGSNGSIQDVVSYQSNRSKA